MIAFLIGVVLFILGVYKLVTYNKKPHNEKVGFLWMGVAGLGVILIMTGLYALKVLPIDA